MSEASAKDGEFLSGDRLSARMRYIAHGDDVRCAVAFWSREGIKELFGLNTPASTVKIVCDISMGATSPDALKDLGAPSNPQLRHHVGLHAKLYLSSRGLIIGSANASLGALGKGDASGRLLETGIFHNAESAAWQSSRDWFEKIHGEADSVDTNVLGWARKVYRAPPSGRQLSRPPKPGSLLEAVRVAPERFAGVGFIFVRTNSTEADRTSAKRSAKRVFSQADPGKIASYPPGGIFTHFPEAKVRTWPTLFFEFWQPKRALTVYGRRVEFLNPKHGSILSASAWREISALLGQDLPEKSLIGKADAELSLLILGSEPTPVFKNANELARRIGELMPS